MDSMRSLNTHLPTSSTQSKSPQPSAELLQAFKSAALAVTQLYKTAAADGDKDTDSAWSAGYQAALDELLAFLDQEDLGLGDGEGWKVRQWATERLSSQTGGKDTEPDSGDTQQRSKDTSRQTTTNKTEDQNEGPTESAPSTLPTITLTSPTASSNNTPPSSNSFDFRSQISMPQNLDMDIDTSERSTSAPPNHAAPRIARKKSLGRDKAHNPGVLSLSTLGQGAGFKRRLPLTEFFDLSGLSSGKDWSDGGPGKKGRLS